MTVDVDARREELLALRARLLTAAEDLVHDDDEDGELQLRRWRPAPRRSRDRHGRSRDRRFARGERRPRDPARSTKRSAARRRQLRHLHRCGEKIPDERLAAVPYATLCVRGQARSGARLSEPARTEALRPSVDIRVGSTPNALIPISSAERSLAAEPWHWLSLARRGGHGGRGRPADQISSSRARSRSTTAVAIDRPALDPPRPNSGIAFGLFASRDVGRDRAHGARGRRHGRLLRAFGPASPRSCRSRSGSCSAAASPTSSTACGSAT